MNDNEPLNKLISDLRERAKELTCLYEVQEILNKSTSNFEEACLGIIHAIPPGWQYPDVCQAKLIYRDHIYQSEGFMETPWVQTADIRVQDEIVGKISVYYRAERPPADEGPFLKEERKLINTIADQFGLYILHRQLKTVFEEAQKNKSEEKREWLVILDLLKRTDPKLLVRISRKMVNYLCWRGIKEAEMLLEQFSPIYKGEKEILKDLNRPYQKQAGSDLLELSYNIFEVAGKYLEGNEVLSSIQKWIKEDRSGFLVPVLEDTGSSLAEISSAIERYHHLAPQGLELSRPREVSFRVALIRRLLSDQPDFINIAKQQVNVDDFNDLLHRIIYPVGSHGKIGGKSSGLFLAQKILRNAADGDENLAAVKTPKTWYLTSDGILNFMNYNNLEDIIEQKYKDINQVRQEFPYVIHVFKNSPFTPEIIKGLSLALDDFGDVPLIVRSSSLLEDRLGAAFAGKYKSLFIANQGSREERLVDLMDAIAEVYASTFGPDPIQYRAEHGLLDYHEEMAIMIQEVVGQQVGHYYFPAFAGVAFSHNEFRWSGRIKREDGLVRIVPGLGTRAVDRLSDDYPILISPGQPQLRVNVTSDEILRYSPKHIDVINLETGGFETIDIHHLLSEYGTDYPKIGLCISTIQDDHLQHPKLIGIDFKKENVVITFEGLIAQTSFIQTIKAILERLQDSYKRPVDIEFAHDGKDFYLLQCRSQSAREESQPVPIPAYIPPENLLFSANRYISNGMVSDLRYIVYVNPQKYGDLSDYQTLLSVGRAVGKLNKLLPRRKFILMGPGRWGSRGDIKLGVSVTYSEINNTALLVEIAKKHKDYVPDLSFGTHFFQDLVESNIRYLPLYPDEEGNHFNESFFLNSENKFTDLLPDYPHLAEVIHVIDLKTINRGEGLTVLMNAENEKAVGILSNPYNK